MSDRAPFIGQVLTAIDESDKWVKFVFSNGYEINVYSSGTVFVHPDPEIKAV